MLRLLAVLSIFVSLSAQAEVKKGLTNESSLGYVITGGNSESESTSFKHNSTYRWDKDILKLTGHYLQSEGQVQTDPNDPTTAFTAVTAENWSAALRFEKIITEKIFNAYIGYGWYGDRFQNVSEGQNIDIGGKYFWLASSSTKFFSELGYRYTRELLVNPPAAAERVGVGSLGHPEYHYIRAFSQIDYEHSKTLTLGFWIEYLPSITDFAKDQRINYSPYLTSVLTDMFSLKVAYESRYRFKPAQVGNELVDFTFTTSLLAKF
ncbi:MAG: DUF481 domain-containing protein [Bdellovibrionales bacterium]|nr:DUF481 domain-containing protein [Bdellovibrionales bacterium]NQZ18418.1 DUF481 domain-containing protein [Bdellovibrionales bacterium]